MSVKIVHARNAQEWIVFLRAESLEATVLVQQPLLRTRLEKLGVANVIDAIQATTYPWERVRECIVLFDTDIASTEACSRTKADLENRGVKANMAYRKFLFNQGLTVTLDHIRGE